MNKLHAEQYSDVELTHMLVDNCAMQLARDPGQFDVMVTTNMFGDILSDGAAAVMGSLGMAPSASLSEHGPDGRRRALYEPVHGSAPDIAGRGIANPLGAIWSLALAMRYSFETRGRCSTDRDRDACRLAGRHSHSRYRRRLRGRINGRDGRCCSRKVRGISRQLTAHAIRSCRCGSTVDCVLTRATIRSRCSV